MGYILPGLDSIRTAVLAANLWRCSKMNNKRVVVLTITLMLIGSVAAFALSDTAFHTISLQVNEVVLIDLDDASPMILSTNTPANGGEDVLGDTDTRLLQYTSLVSAGTTRKITANWGGGDSAPAGTVLKLEATNVQAGCGSADAQITVTAVAQDLVSTIGSCATGIGANGTEITYTCEITDVTALVVGGGTGVTITYTLTDEA